MISIAIITFGVCLVLIAFINAVKTFAIDNARRAHRAAAMNLWKSIINFVDEFNDTYENTQVEFYVDHDGVPHIEAHDVEPETAE